MSVARRLKKVCMDSVEMESMKLEYFRMIETNKKRAKKGRKGGTVV